MSKLEKKNECEKNTERKVSYNNNNNNKSESFLVI